MSTGHVIYYYLVTTRGDLSGRLVISYTVCKVLLFDNQKADYIKSIQANIATQVSLKLF